MTTPDFNSQPLVVSVGAQCHVGKQRTENQDRVTRAATAFGDLFVVADGVGGYQGGAEAAQATVDGFVSFLNTHGSLPLPEALQQAVRSISSDLKRRSSANPAMHGMGSTVVLCVVNNGVATYAHAGDSRAYLLRDGQLKQLTRDHSVMQRMVSQGLLTPAQAREHPDASVLTRAIGQGPDVWLDVGEMILRANDAILLCSDGLWAYAPHPEIEAIAASDGLSASSVAAALLNLAMEGGGGDNISVQFLRFQPSAASKKTEAWWGVSPKLALAAVMVASLLAIATAWLSVENRHHPKDNPSREDPIAVAASVPRSTPAPDIPVKANPPKPASPAQESKGDQAPASAPASNKPDASGENAEQSEKTPVGIIQLDSSPSGWTERLTKLRYLELSSRTSNDECLALERSADTLLYISDKADVAQQVQRDLSLPASAVVVISKEELGKCGDEPMIALPARPTLSKRLETKAAAEAQAAKTGIKTGIDTVKKKSKEKVEGQDTPSN